MRRIEARCLSKNYFAFIDNGWGNIKFIPLQQWMIFKEKKIIFNRNKQISKSSLWVIWRIFLQKICVWPDETVNCLPLKNENFHIRERLLIKRRHTHDSGVRIIRNSDGALECHDYQDFKKFFLDEDIELTKDEFLFMKTRIRHGRCVLKTLMYNLSLEIFVFLKTLSMVSQKR